MITLATLPEEDKLTLKQIDILETLEKQETLNKNEAFKRVKLIFGSTATDRDFEIAFRAFK